MTANKGPDSDLIFSLGIIFAEGPALPLIAAVGARGRQLHPQLHRPLQSPAALEGPELKPKS